MVYLKKALEKFVRLFMNNGGMVYMDGANMNAQVGLTAPGFIGADVCHLEPAQNICYTSWWWWTRNGTNLCE